MITFSFRPSSRSVLPSIDASVSTFVVSWKEAAERKDSVASDAFVIPRISGSNVACSPFSFLTREFSRSRRTLSDSWPGRSSVLPEFSMRTFFEHLPDDQLDVLVVDLDALRLVDALHLTHEVELGLSRALAGTRVQLEQLRRGDQPSVRASPCSTMSPFFTSRRVRRGEQVSCSSGSPSLPASGAPRDGDRLDAAAVGVLERDLTGRSPQAARRPSGSAPRRSRRRAAGRA